MKNIVVMTDFSKNAEAAAEVGVKLSSKLKTNLLLFNTYVTNAAVPFVSEPWTADELIWGDDDSRDNLNKLAAQLKRLTGDLPRDAYQPLIYCDSGEGRLDVLVPDIIKARNVEIIIMGARLEDPDKDNLFGSDLNAVIQKSNRPVLVIPPGFDPFKLKKVVLATNFEKTDVQAIRYLVKLGEVLGFELEIVHVIKPGSVNNSNGLDQVAQAEQNAREMHPNITYHPIRGEEIADDILRLYRESDAGLLAVVHHQHSFIGRIFHQSITKKILNNGYLPLMIFPSRLI